MSRQMQSFDPRQVMKNKTFEIFHTLDKTPHAVEMHHHDFFEIYYFIGGNVEYRVEGRSYVLQPGDLLLIRPWEFHQPVASPGTPYERIVLWIDRGWLAQCAGDSSSLSACFTESPENLLHPSRLQRTTLSALLDRFVREAHGTQPDCTLYAYSLFLQFMLEVNRMVPKNDRQETPAEQSGLINQVLDYISGHYAEKLTLEGLAEQFYVSKYHLAHEFSAKAGTSLYRYILLKRLQAAREMIAAGHSPGSACQSCGFQDYANFYRAFRAEYGMSPRQCADS